MKIMKRLKDFSAAHRLLNYDGVCKNLHGHTYHIEVSLNIDESEMDKRDLLFDFNNFKEWDEYIQNTFDHKTIVNIKDKSFIKFLEKERMKFVTLIGNPTVENMLLHIKGKFCSLLQKYDMEEVECEITIWETETSKASIIITK